MTHMVYMDMVLEDEKIREKQREENRERKRTLKRFLKQEEKKGRLGGHDRTGTRVTESTLLKPLKVPDGMYNTQSTATSGGSSVNGFNNNNATSLPDVRAKGSVLSLPLGPTQGVPTRGRSRSKRKKPCNILKNESQLLGKGANGTVFMGLNSATGELVAVKDIMFKYAVRDVKEQINSVINEIALMKRLSHPNIVRYLGAERNDGMLQIFMEYVPGGSLRSIITHFGRLQENIVKKYTKQMLSGLEYLHNEGVAHLDIKADNALLDVSGVVKLADFGASERLEGLSTKTVGTPCFMAPEVVKGTGHDRSADIWSIGITVIELLVGEPPDYGCKEAFAVMYKIASMSDPPEAPANSSDQCRFFLQNCLRRHPTTRLTASQLLATDFILYQECDISDSDSEPGMEPSHIAAPPPPSLPPQIPPLSRPLGDQSLVKSYITACSRRTLTNTVEDIRYMNMLSRRKGAGVLTDFEVQTRKNALLSIRSTGQLTPCADDVALEEF